MTRSNPTRNGERAIIDSCPCGCGSHKLGDRLINLYVLGCLAFNLAQAAALCRAHEIATDEAEDHRLYHEHGYRLDGCWKPGCGWSAP